MKKGKNIYKRKDGRWEARVIIGRTGRYPTYKYLYGKSYREADDKKRSFEKNWYMQSIAAAKEEGLNFQDTANLWLENCKSQWKDSTRAIYAECLELKLLPRWGNVALSDLRQNDYDSLIADFEGSLNGNSLQTINTVLNGIMKYSVKAGLLPANPFVVQNNLKKTHKDTVKALSQNDIIRLTDHCLNYFDQKTLGVLIALYEGLRIGELCALRWGDIDFDEGVIHIRRTLQRIRVFHSADGAKSKLHFGPPKNGRERSIPIHPILPDMLQELQGPDSHYILRGDVPYEPKSYSYHFKRILENARIRDVHFHMLRHTFATSCVEAGMNIKVLSEILGHSSVKITMDRYVHLSMAYKAEQLSILQFTVPSFTPSKLWAEECENP